ncbi:MAG: desulfoferrodoxin [Defluviitaleaceae bacterium]|nr:desulfoferrodoxin [Defluviitaleaceae bacterium]
MRGRQKFFVCGRCGNLVGLICDNGAPMQCCGEPLKELVPNTADAAGEKHLPVVSKAGGKFAVNVGSVPHPMEEGHHIKFVFVETDRGGHRKGLSAGEAPKAEFCFAGDGPVAAYAYCNLHGLWKTDEV